jgi:trehalose/maltose hydrolase-like predicted phosphorylase
MRVLGEPGGVAAAAIDRTKTFGDRLIVSRVSVYGASGDDLPHQERAIGRVRSAAASGFDFLLAEHRQAWAARWEDADIVVEGDADLQRAIRFALFHLMSSTLDSGEAAVGARGLSGTSYSGHVFWDADTFTLPFLAATHPRAARAMLEYRVRRLPAARAAAAEAGRSGARFPWESAHSGRDVTPVSAQDRTGKTVAIRTGQLEDHIVAQVAWATSCYLDWTGDAEFGRGPGLELLVETARYWASRVREESDGMHIYGVIGPDEYHEPVDDNAFTNVMARWNLRRAAQAVLQEDAGGDLVDEAARWRAVSEELVDGFDPDSGVYEQFAGFRKLEPLIIAEVAPRRPIAADLLLGTSRVSGAQVVKQADVLMLHHLIPDEVEPGTLEPNLAFYEPRTAHGSSLSPGIHASLFARARQYDRALNALRMACRMDLDDLTSSTGGGLHLATMGSMWQALAFGFAGLRPDVDHLRVDPRLPPTWAGLEIRVRYHDLRVRLRVEHDQLSIEADGPVPLVIDGAECETGQGTLTLPRRRHGGEENQWRRS